MINIETLKLILLKSDLRIFKNALEDYNINEFDKFGNNILHYYIKNTKSILLDFKDVIDVLNSKGIDINGKRPKGVFKGSPLQLAVSMKLKDITDYLIEIGADVNSVDEYGKPILMTAVLGYQEPNGYFIEKLIKSGANVFMETSTGNSPIKLAYGIDNNDVKKYFPPLIDE